MQLSHDEKQEIAQMVVKILDSKSRPKINQNWTSLQKDIEQYCRDTKAKVRWYTLQTKIYDSIRAVLDISRVDNMTNEQVIEARKVFEFIKQEREKALWNS